MKNNLQQIRWEKEWSQHQLAQYSGVSRTMITCIENGKRPNPSILTVLLLAKALKVDVEDIFTLG